MIGQRTEDKYRNEYMNTITISMIKNSQKLIQLNPVKSDILNVKNLTPI